jgi:hypothetical protein
MSYLCSNVSDQRTTGLTQDQHTNSGRRLPFVLLHFIATKLTKDSQRWSHCQKRPVGTVTLDTHWGRNTRIVSSTCITDSNANWPRTAVFCNVTPRSFSVIDVSKTPLPSQSLIPRIVTQTGHNLNQCRACCGLRTFSLQPLKHLVTQNIHSFTPQSYDRSAASSEASSPYSAIQCLHFQFPVSSLFLKATQ